MRENFESSIISIHNTIKDRNFSIYILMLSSHLPHHNDRIIKTDAGINDAGRLL